MDLRFLLLQLCFFLSGFAALLYETAWTREFAFVFGTSELAVSAVLAAYMAGLALGAAIAARLAPRIARPILAYGVIELGIGVGALIVPFAIRGLMGIYVGWLGGLSDVPEDVSLLSAIFHLAGAFVVLIPCTALMGATLPLLARHAVRREDEIGPRVGLLYAVNTAGAIFGALVAAFLLLPSIGLRQTIYVGAAVNGLVFLAAAALARAVPPSGEVPPRRVRGPFLILPLIAISGMVSFVYEVLWVRLLAYVLGGSTAAFATMLASFLMGIALGSAVASRVAKKYSSATVGFAAVQTGTALCAITTFSLAGFLPEWSRALGAGPANLLPGALLAVLILLPVTLCIGATFPFAVRILAVDANDAASASARVYAWNTLGSIVGSVGAGFLLLPLLGFAGTISLGIALNLLLAVTAAWLLVKGRISVILAVTALCVGLVLVWARPAPPLKILKMVTLTGRTSAGDLEYLGIGRSASVALMRTAYSWRLVSNGLPEASIQHAAAPPPRSQEAEWLSLLPLLVRPDASQFLVIGLGGGNTLAAVPNTVDRIDLIELEPEVVRANRQVGSARRFGNPLDDPRLNLRLGDARGSLMLTDVEYDAIISQPSHPWTSGASHLYTQEFFEMVRERLAPGGVFVQWMGPGFVTDDLLRGLVATLGDVFENVMVFRPRSGAILFVASAEPFSLRESSARAISLAPEELAQIGVYTPEDVFASLVLDVPAARAFSEGADRITDDWNRLAWMKSTSEPTNQGYSSLVEALNEHYPLGETDSEINLDLLVRRIFSPQGQQRLGKARSLRLEALIESRPEAEKARVRGWDALAAGRLDAAFSHFSTALELDPEAVPARVGLELARPGSTDPDTLPPNEALLIRARRYARARDWDRLRELDTELARWPTGGLFFPEVQRLRIRWRSQEPGPVYAAEVLELIDPLIALGGPDEDLLVRALASARAGRIDSAWASLHSLSVATGKRSNSRALAQASLALGRKLPPRRGSDMILKRLRAQAKDN
ncbi:MAG: fused MFS/spermidine synthase [Myxococcota bacterium]